MTVPADEPLLVVRLLELRQRSLELRQSLERAHPQELLLQRADEASVITQNRPKMIT